MGRLTNDPELKTTTNLIEYCVFTVAVQRTANKEQTDFIDAIAWRQSARFINQYFKKGSMIAIQGHIETDNYTDSNGNKRKAVKIVVDNASFCSKKTEQERSPSAPDISIPPPEDSDLPF